MRQAARRQTIGGNHETEVMTVMANLAWGGVLLVGSLVGFGTLMFVILIRGAKSPGMSGCAIAALAVFGALCIGLGILFAGCGACGTTN